MAYGLAGLSPAQAQQLPAGPAVKPWDAVLVASGDLREEANRVCWPAQKAMEKDLAAAFSRAGWTLDRGHAVSRQRGHGFIASAREGLDVFSRIDPHAPLVVAEAVWQYSNHVLPGLTTHQGPILTAANWSGQWPGLVGMLNLNGSHGWFIPCKLVRFGFSWHQRVVRSASRWREPSGS